MQGRAVVRRPFHSSLQWTTAILWCCGSGVRDIFTLISKDTEFSFRQTLTIVSRHPQYCASVDFSDHWCWESDCLILVGFDTKGSVFWHWNKYNRLIYSKVWHGCRLWAKDVVLLWGRPLVGPCRDWICHSIHIDGASYLPPGWPVHINLVTTEHCSHMQVFIALP